MDMSAGSGLVSRGRAGSTLAAMRRILGWPGRVCQARRLMAVFDTMAEDELHDIGLTRADLHAARALPLDADPSEVLRRRAEDRRRRSRADPARTRHRIS